MNRQFWSVCLVAFLLGPTAAGGRADDPVRLTGIFSDLAYRGEDLVGTEVFILGVSDGYVAMVQH